MLRKLGQYLLANPYHAMAVALLCAVLPLLSLPGGFLAGVLVGFITLGRGYKSGLLVLAGVAIPAIIMALWKKVFLIDILFCRCVLVWILAMVFRATVSWRLVLEIMTLLGILAVGIFYLSIGDVSGWWVKTLTHYQSLFSTILSGISEEKLKQMMAQVVPVATGLLTALILVGAFCQLLLARWWQSTIYRPGGLIKEFIEIRNGYILAVLFSIILLVAFFGLGFAVDLLPVAILPLAISGLSLGHKWIRINKKMIYLLVFVYIGLVFLPVIFIAILAVLGYIDTWWNFRKRVSFS